MLRMMIYYVVSVALLLTGIGILGWQVANRLFLTGMMNSDLALLGGVAPLLVGRIALWRARRLHRRIEGAHRQQLVIDLVRRRGQVGVDEVARAIDIPAAEAQKLLEGLVRQGHADVEVSQSGQTLFTPGNERRALGA